jgi:hypothetical protein
MSRSAPEQGQLRAIQERMAAAVMHPLTRQETMPERRRDGKRNRAEADAIIKPNDRLTSFERLEIYNRQYWFRLYTSFEEDFPGLRAIVGRKPFDGLMRAYLTDCPSTSFSLRNLGSKLEAWLEEHREWIEPRAELALDMVRLEWAHIEAFDSASEPAPTAEDMAGVDEATRFRLQPYLYLLRLHYPVDDLLIQVRSETGSSDTSSNNAVTARRTSLVRKVADLAPEVLYLAVHRYQNSVYYKRLEREDFLMLEALGAGLGLGEAIEAAFQGSAIAEDDRPGFLQEAFQSWSMMGWFQKPAGAQESERIPE